MVEEVWLEEVEKKRKKSPRGDRPEVEACLDRRPASPPVFFPLPPQISCPERSRLCRALSLARKEERKAREGVTKAKPFCSIFFSFVLVTGEETRRRRSNEPSAFLQLGKRFPRFLSELARKLR